MPFLSFKFSTVVSCRANPKVTWFQGDFLSSLHLLSCQEMKCTFLFQFVFICQCTKDIAGQSAIATKMIKIGFE